MDIKQKRGQILRDLRIKKGLKQSEIADVLGITQQAYQRYEYGTSEPNADGFSFLADFYGVSTDYLLGREKPDDPLEVMGIKVRDVDDDAFIKMYRELPDNAKCVFLDVMKKLAGAGAKDEQESTAPDYGPMKYSAVTGDIIAAEAEKDA